mgnify:CR=1 FL=1
MAQLIELEEKVSDLEMKLRDAESRVRASEIVLFKEREQAAVTVRSLLTTIDELRAQNAALEHVKKSVAWRMARPLRVLGRLRKGEWREVARQIKTRFFSKG